MASQPTKIIAVVVVVLACLVVMDARPGAAESRGAPTARDETLFGMDVPSLRALDDSESAVGARAAIVGTFADWAHARDFPRDVAEAINGRGAVPSISWEPWDSWDGTADQPAYALSRIVAGDHDALIDRWATEIRAYKRPVMVRFAPEMNGDWLPWSTGVNGNRAGEYVAAWRHVRARFRQARADNVVWVWNPIATYDGATPLRDLFPGPREVDWLAVDGYNWGSTRAWGWQSYADVFAPTLRELATLAAGAPVMIAETGSAPDARKAAWVTDTLRSARADGVDALMWFEFSKETDWRLAEDPAAARAASLELRRPGWHQGGQLSTIERSVS